MNFIYLNFQILNYFYYPNPLNQTHLHHHLLRKSHQIHLVFILASAQLWWADYNRFLIKLLFLVPIFIFHSKFLLIEVLIYLYFYINHFHLNLPNYSLVFNFYPTIFNYHFDIQLL
jgi:hypothetical protein